MCFRCYAGHVIGMKLYAYVLGVLIKTSLYIFGVVHIFDRCIPGIYFDKSEKLCRRVINQERIKYGVNFIDC